MNWSLCAVSDCKHSCQFSCLLPPVTRTASFSVRPHCKNARQDRCQEYHNCFPFGELEETTRTSSNYVDEDYPARPEIKQSLPGWGDNCGSESSTLETDVCVWRYAPLVVHATQEEEEEEEEVTRMINLTSCLSLTVNWLLIWVMGYLYLFCDANILNYRNENFWY